MITVKDLRTLINPQGWLNSDIINYYCQLLAERQQLLRSVLVQLPSCTITNTFFYPMLIQDQQNHNYDQVKRHYSAKQFIIVDRVIIPCHVNGNHWITVLINMKERKIKVYDSLKCIRTKESEISSIGSVSISELFLYIAIVLMYKNRN